MLLSIHGKHQYTKLYTDAHFAPAVNRVNVLVVVVPDQLSSSFETRQSWHAVRRHDKGIRPRAVVEAVCKPVGFFHSGASPENVAHETDVGRTACRCTCVLQSLHKLQGNVVAYLT